MFQFQGFKGNELLNVFYSTDPTINNLFSSNIRIPIIRSAELDDNRDGIADRIEIGVQLPIYSDEQIIKMNAIVYHNIELKDKAKYRFDAVSYLSYSNPLPIQYLYIDGDINVKQTWSLDVKGGSVLYYSYYYLFYL